MLALFTGLLTGLSLIIAIGAQNAFVLRQGLRREHVLWVVVFCSLSDAVLIFLGIAGLGALISSVPIALEVIRYAGAAYLVWFGLLALRRATRPQALDPASSSPSSLKKTIFATAAITFLNPHVYLDTVILLGGVGNQFGDERWAFGFGAAVGSAVWFFIIGYGAKLATRFVSRPSFWRILDTAIAVVMFSIAILLLTFQF
jgi:L-lysine exporter family protein LysE/ArgO